ncbi:ribonuclease HII [Jonquetella anthropi DSM 22815]|uniref:Ribonuclease HII n=1 Tax=Jonquetella anthropi DSM 22815 TaxID=885272 RepID=H0UMI7_9BACT|nr:ribonuclease HII [Jonquetella anthropi]EEX47785.1 ribonuclease HII [Jonquetella anthropi E3_33 E1]EHM13690.1 ribonuclease HII [Jonquetella anthropi DSM 22815]
MILAGVDEAGRGPLAGPVMAAAVILSPEQKNVLVQSGLRDSKKLSAKKREKLFGLMQELGVVWRLQAASRRRIDRMNILQATLWAMARAVNRLPATPDGVAVDGSQEIPGISLYQQAIVGGDDLYPEISAASVVAKVVRDRLMTALDRLYPGYGLAQHKGYGTAQHQEALLRLGPTPLHRRSFCWGTADGLRLPR